MPPLAKGKADAKKDGKNADKPACAWIPALFNALAPKWMSCTKVELSFAKKADQKEGDQKAQEKQEDRKEGARSALVVTEWEQGIAQRKLNRDAASKSSQAETLCRVVESGDLARVKTILQQQDVSLSNKGRRGIPAWLVAAGRGFLDIVLYALAEGMDVEDVDDRDRTALMLAAAGGHVTTCAALLRAGAVATGKDTIGRTALVYAVFNGFANVAALLKGATPPPQAQVSGGGSRKTVASASKINCKSMGASEVLDEYGYSLVRYACMSKRNCFEILRWVCRVQQGDVDQPDNQGQTPLMALVSRPDCSLEMLKYLIWAKADVGHQRDDGNGVVDLATATAPLLDPPRLMAMTHDEGKGTNQRAMSPLAIDGEEPDSDQVCFSTGRFRAVKPEIVEFLEVVSAGSNKHWYHGGGKALAEFFRTKHKDAELALCEMLRRNFAKCDPKDMCLVIAPPSLEPPLVTAIGMAPNQQALAWVQFLSTHKADPDHADLNGYTPLCHAVETVKRRDLALLLISDDVGGSVLTFDNYGRSPILLACAGEDAKLVEKLVAKFDKETSLLKEPCVVSMLCRDSAGWGPLHWACYGGDVNLIQMLVETFGEKTVKYLTKRQKQIDDGDIEVACCQIEGPPPLFCACLSGMAVVLNLFEKLCREDAVGLEELLGAAGVEELYDCVDPAGHAFRDYVYRRVKGVTPLEDLRGEARENQLTVMTWYKANAPESEVPMIFPNEKLPEWAREAEQPVKKRGGMIGRLTQLGPIVAKNSKFDKKKGKHGNERKAGETDDGGFDHTTCEETEVLALASFHPGDMLFSVNTSKKMGQKFDQVKRFEMIDNTEDEDQDKKIVSWQCPKCSTQHRSDAKELQKKGKFCQSCNELVAKPMKKKEKKNDTGGWIFT